LIEQKRRVNSQKRRVTIILVSMVVIFGLSSLPHTIVSLITEFDVDYGLMSLPK
jgi:Na+(H+)/acetate symporter ActP